VTTSTEHFDILIVGAGISGIDAAYHLQQHCPARRFTLLESQESFGGTWLTHKFPGIRSDSDLYTFGYKWKPWSGPPIATAPEILASLNEVLDEQDIRHHIRFRHAVTAPQSGRVGIAAGRSTCGVVRVARPRSLPATSFGCVRDTIATTKGLRQNSPGENSSRDRSCTRKPGQKTSITKTRPLL
jgi:hypothetical protein